MTISPPSIPPSIRVAVVGDCPVDLWGISSAERIRRQLRALGPYAFADEDVAAGGGDPVLFVRADYLLEDRTLADLLTARNTVLRDGDDDSATVVAVRANRSHARQALEAVRGSQDWKSDGAWSVETVESLSASYMRKLRKASPPQLWAIEPHRADELEAVLFGNSYKGVTDLVTKFVWPRPARRVTKFCALRGISPNAVTSASLVLAALATVLFYNGCFLTGLVLAWVMTFLDTVDGKLARVTVTSTTFGNFFDHGIDIIGPPVWYIAWAYGLPDASFAGFTLLGADMERLVLLELILGGYVAGRMVEGTFDWGMAGFPIFIWRPLDSWFRLIIARRNPNLIFLTLFALLGHPLAGLVAVAAWTVLCTVFLLGRLAVGIRRRVAEGPLQPWLQAPLPGDLASPLAQPFL